MYLKTNGRAGLKFRLSVAYFVGVSEMPQCCSVGTQNGQKQSLAHKLSKIHSLCFKVQLSSVK